ncbi:hypothetical protein [Nocardia sp. bgisy134]|uniref:hypothetical protein n=1 Tax=unclassified Nocardia TaxID=2637762 RepID=UPI003D766096
MLAGAFENSDTTRAFGDLGFTDNVAWADPERPLSCAVLTSGKPILYPEVIRWIGLLYGITSQTPKVADTDLAFRAGSHWRKEEFRC